MVIIPVGGAHKAVDDVLTLGICTGDHTAGANAHYRCSRTIINAVGERAEFTGGGRVDRRKRTVGSPQKSMECHGGVIEASYDRQLH
jgi:hypothetical protein